MGLKERVMELLRAADGVGLKHLAGGERRAVRPLLARAWDPDPTIRALAASTLGHVAVVHPDLGLEIVRRLMWALNDESATNGVHALAPLGEIGHRAPELLAPFVPALVAMSWDDGLRRELWRALARIADAAPRLLAPHRDELARYRNNVSATERSLLERLIAANGRGET
jgi:HEAT repeat protein